MKILAKRKKDCNPIYDTKGKMIWDGKAKNITLTEGDEDVISYMFESLKGYVNLNEWTIKKRK